MSDREEATFDPTPHRRQLARERGHVAYSQDLASAAMLFSGLLLLKWFGPGILQSAANLFSRGLSEAGSLVASRDTMLNETLGSLQWLAIILLPLLGLLMVAGVLVNASQLGLRFHPDRLAPDWGRVSPLQGLHRIFSLSGLARFCFGLLKIVVVITVSTTVLWNHREALLACGSLELAPLVRFLLTLLFDTALWVAGALLALAFVDYGFQRWKFEQDLRMTPQEVRDEMKNMQGDPQIAAQRRKSQRHLARNSFGDVIFKTEGIV